MLAGIVISALLAGPAVARLIPRQTTLTTTQTSTSTHFVYAPADKTTILPFLPSGTASSANGAITLAPGINPINGLPAAPPVRPSNKTDIPKSSTTIRPIVFTTSNGTLKAIYKSGPASTFAVPPSSSSTSTITSTSTISSTISSTRTTSTTSSLVPISFKTFTPTPGVKVTVTNKPISSSSSSSLSGAPPQYSALSQAPPQASTTSSTALSSSSSSKKTRTINAAPTTTTSTVLSKSTSSSTNKPTIVITPVPDPDPTTKSTGSATPTPEPTIESTSSAEPSPEPTKTSTEKENAYPYPTPDKDEPKTNAESTKWNYPYPTS